MKSKIYLGTSWKMNKTWQEAQTYVTGLAEQLPVSPHLQVFLVAPFTVLWQMKSALQGTPVLLGAQNMHWAEAGPYTGEVSPLMLSEIGVDLVELGHSERRALFGETDYRVNQKVLAALCHNLIPLVCVGESRQEKDFGVTTEVIARQVKIALHGVPAEQASRVWLAYEPVWAIGEGGMPAEPAYADAVQGYIRQVLIELFGPEAGRSSPILYGGSVNQENAAALIRQPNMDGLFIGRAAWQPDSFAAIIQASLAAIASPSPVSSENE